jgi:hypothetical protein
MDRWYVAKSKAHGDTFASVFGPGSVGKGNRVRPVYAWQCGDTHDTVGLPYLFQIYGEPATFFHSIACAPYLTAGDVVSSPQLTVQDMLDGWRSYQQNISLAGPWGMGRVNYVAQMSAAAAYWGLFMQAYESGPDTVEGIDSGPPLWAKANASADARITAIIVDHLQSWHSYGAHMGPENYYTLGAGMLQNPYGIYTVLQDMSIMSSPKLAAIDLARSTAVAISPLIPSLPAVLNASFFVGHPQPPSPNGFNGWPDTLDYFVQNSGAQPLQVTVQLSAGTDDSTPTTIGISLSGESRNTQNVTCPPSGNWATYVNCSLSGVFTVPPGSAVFRLVHRGRPWIGQLDIATV